MTKAECFEIVLIEARGYVDIMFVLTQYLGPPPKQVVSSHFIITKNCAIEHYSYTSMHEQSGVCSLWRPEIQLLFCKELQKTFHDAVRMAQWMKINYLRIPIKPRSMSPAV